MMVRPEAPLCGPVWQISVDPVSLLGRGRAAELLCYVPEQRAVAPPSARVPQYGRLSLARYRSVVSVQELLIHCSVVFLK